MTEEKGKPESDESCCSDKSGKGCGCGSSGCGGCGYGRGCKCFRAFLLVLIGFLAGYFLSHRCHSKPMMCCNEHQGQMMNHLQCPVAGDAGSATTPTTK